ncbi:BQ2448_838 [Microbotryum intermedium]|uniref:BQ2448_838 protein n=1 Tax=Microbotryum intermedium TaxID=269621 RepID=A0A238F6F8_9BASI|nr:BQ2448_838 [Microbotryum intermedium]
MSSSSKPYEVVVWGATGFTGQLVAHYLSTSPTAEGLKWAVAGRSKTKLEQRMQEVDVDVPVIIADAGDAESLDELCKQTRCIIALVGPYARYGEPLVKACAENGVHYVDLTGEAPFVARMVKNHGRAAVSTKAIIIHACGYDSVPSDLCAYLVAQRLKSAGAEVGPVRGIASFKGGVSGGTFATILDSIQASKEDKKITMNPYGLSPIHGKHKPGPVVAKSATLNGRRHWGAFWIMVGRVHRLPSFRPRSVDSWDSWLQGPFNSAIVRRSWGILEGASDSSSRVLSYGSNFSYDEWMGVTNPVIGLLASLTLFIAFGFLIFVPPIRWLAQKYGPQSGDGPSEKMQKTGWFKLLTIAKSTDGKQEVAVTMKGKGDPGYAATSKMISECALAIVKDYERLPPLARHGGILTPATALGPVLVERLEKTGYFSFTTSSEGKRIE